MLKTKNKRKSKKLNEKKNTGRNNKIMRVQEDSVVSAVLAASEDASIVFSWVTVDFIKKPVTEFYFVIAAVGAMAMIGWGIYDRNFTVVIVFIMLVVLIILALNEEPKKVNVRISEKGIDLNGEHYNYNEFRSFKISYVDGALALILNQRKSFMPFRNIYIEDQPVNDLEMFLGIYLEKEQEENMEEKGGGEERKKE